MASRPKPTSVVDSETLKCSVCKESNPNQSELTLLPCEHRLCAHCTQLVSASAATASPGAKCPSCIAKSEVSGDAEKAVLPPSDDCRPPPVCANTTGEHGPVSVFCSDCNKFYCESCFKSHDLFDFMKGHDIRPIRKMSFEAVNEASSSVCPEHELSKNIWCKKCHRLMCSTCGLFEHKDHLVQKLTDALSEAQKKLDSVIADAEDYILKQDQNLAEMDQTEREIKANIQSARKAVEKAAQKLRDIITKRERDLVTELDRRETEVLSKLKTMYEKSVAKKIDAQALKNSAKSLCQTSNHVDKIEQAGILPEKYCAMKKSKYQKVRWSSDLKQEELVGELTEIDRPLGRVELKCTLASPNRASLGDPLQTIPLVNREGPVSGMVILGDWLCVTHYGNLNLWLYNIMSGQHQTCPVPELADPRGLTLIQPSNTISIADENSEGCKLHLLKLSKEMKIADQKVKDIPLKKPRRITFAEENGELLIGSVGTSYFVVTTKEGDLVKKVEITDTANYYPFCVIDTGEGYVTLMWSAGSFLWSWGYCSRIQWADQQGSSSGVHGEQLKQPRHFVMSKDGTLIIADSGNHRVLLVEGKGKQCQTLLTHQDGIYSPDCLYLDEEAGRLYVAHTGQSAEARIYRWPFREFQTNDFKLSVHLTKIE